MDTLSLDERAKRLLTMPEGIDRELETKTLLNDYSDSMLRTGPYLEILIKVTLIRYLAKTEPFPLLKSNSKSKRGRPKQLSISPLPKQLKRPQEQTTEEWLHDLENG
jgi:hypothetical protein